MTPIAGGVTAPKGYRAAGVLAGIKQGATKRDCALVVSDSPAAVAGMFTRNLLKAPPVQWCEDVCRRGAARAAFINSGNANAATGERGFADARRTAEWLAGGLGFPAEEICVSSTGVIGVPLPMDRIEQGVAACIGALSADGNDDAAEAIMTTDTVPKTRAVEVPLSTGTIRIGAMAKGSGMIAPNMATMICIITTDAAIELAALSAVLRPAVTESFNRICVDNDMSTSDTVLCFANGASGVTIQSGSEDFETFAQALAELCRHMAQWLVRDGEGATKFVEIAVEGAASGEDAARIARAVGASQLCKTAFFGEDPNWGRFACAAGYAGAAFDPAQLAIWLDDVQLMADGLAADYREEDAAAVMKQQEFRIRIAVGSGPGEAVFWTSDLSHDYVSINADYRT